MLLLSAFAQAQDNDNDTNVIEWSAARKLAWDDFQGRVPAVALEAALSQCGFGYATNSVTKRETLIVTVSARFYRNESWSRADKRSIRLLQHEQRHFDLCELYARKLRQQLASEHYTGTDMKKVDKLYDTLMGALNKAQQEYDDETTHGLNTDKQNEWNDRIAKELNALSAYSAPAP
ncbi:MAG: DUF922 domain-containing protein [Bacteroidetes bacterium]|nr:DUF922 domain-containing protein [Bacteroidota bacterium]